ncbi:MAG: hypothetical protein HYZ63_03935 [Candidatus Andersenbacteria bacterium]|nr:hypothetical protein [Candidatus Andersenbacteria bacterium]
MSLVARGGRNLTVYLAMRLELRKEVKTKRKRQMNTKEISNEEVTELSCIESEVRTIGELRKEIAMYGDDEPCFLNMGRRLSIGSVGEPIKKTIGFD